MDRSTQARNEAAAAGPLPFEIGGRVFVVPRMQLPDFAAWRRELRRQVQGQMDDPVATANREISAAERAGAPLSPTMARMMIQEAMAAASARQKVEPTDAQLGVQADTLDGLRWLVWWNVRKADAGVTPADVAGWIPDEAALWGLREKIQELIAAPGLNPN